ncbi:MAG: Unknown protein [uncultured Aureispira sp.]|uniref:Uncharacterized protein n=1 Tax=uncultured Aureispira sp. TaxID=1331704 RepID=A0A6S6U677_9BACT|nr:MAG: Unknown protein [uncultured Aureispira sp.]
MFENQIHLTPMFFCFCEKKHPFYHEKIKLFQKVKHEI